MEKDGSPERYFGVKFIWYKSDILSKMNENYLLLHVIPAGMEVFFIIRLDPTTVTRGDNFDPKPKYSQSHRFESRLELEQN